MDTASHKYLEVISSCFLMLELIRQGLAGGIQIWLEACRTVFVGAIPWQCRCCHTAISWKDSIKAKKMLFCFVFVIAPLEMEFVRLMNETIWGAGWFLSPDDTRGTLIFVWKWIFLFTTKHTFWCCWINPRTHLHTHTHIPSELRG